MIMEKDETMEAPANNGSGRRPRNLQLDAMKGLAIFLVVLGHCIQSNVVKFDDNVLFRIIYSFHMPLFMFLSGYLAFNPNRELELKYLGKKFQVLVIPCLIWYMVSYWINYYLPGRTDVGLEEYIIRFFKSPDWGLWFLWVLFVNFCVLYLATLLSRYIKDFAYIIAVIAVNKITIGVLGWGLVQWHIPFFIGGYLLAKDIDKWMFWRTYVLGLSAAAFPLLVSIWKRTMTPEGVTNFAKFLSEHRIRHCETIVIYGYLYLVPFLGIGVSYLVVCIIKKTRIYQWLIYLGGFTMEIYILHFYFLSVRFGTGVTAIITGTVMALIISHAVAQLLEKNVWLKRILFGRF